VNPSPDLPTAALDYAARALMQKKKLLNRRRWLDDKER
jgi:hypothetical protein